MVDLINGRNSATPHASPNSRNTKEIVELGLIFSLGPKKKSL